MAPGYLPPGTLNGTPTGANPSPPPAGTNGGLSSQRPLEQRVAIEAMARATAARGEGITGTQNSLIPQLHRAGIPTLSIPEANYLLNKYGPHGLITDSTHPVQRLPVASSYRDTRDYAGATGNPSARTGRGRRSSKMDVSF